MTDRTQYRRASSIQAGWLVFGFLSWPCLPGIYSSLAQGQMGYLIFFHVYLLFTMMLALSVRWQTRLATSVTAAINTWNANSHLD